MDVDCAGPSSARRRRERRLRSWWRHERMSVAAALAEAHHHSSLKVGAAPNNAPRSQKTARASGEHPGVLREPEVQLEAATVGHVAASVPSLATPSLADAAGDAVDGESIRFLLWCALKTPEQVEAAKQASLRRQSKAAAKKEKEMAEVDVEASSSQRRKKKRKKKKLPKSRGPLLPQVLRQGRLRRGAEARPHSLSRQWHVHGWCCWFLLLRAVFPSVVVRPEMPCIMAGMDLKERFSGMIRLVLMVTFLLALCSLLSFAGPECSPFWPVWTRRTAAGNCFFGSLYLAVTCAVCSTTRQSLVPSSPLEYKSMDFLEDDFWYVFRIQFSLVRQWIHAWRQSTRPFGFHIGIRQSLVRGPSRARWCADTSIWTRIALPLRGSSARVHCRM